MIARYGKAILIVTGLVTLFPLLAFLLPANFVAMNQLRIGDAAGLLFMRHWGLEVACIGGLLVYAAFDAAARVPILVAAIIGKAGIVWLLLARLADPALAGMRITLAFDVVCVALYVAYLLTWDRRSA
jgi:hypothetical protein